MEIKNKFQARKVALEIERMESAVKKMKKELKNYVEQNGAVETEDQVWFIEQSTNWKFNNLLGLVRGINQRGLNPYIFLNITPTNLKKLDFTEEQLEQFGGVKRERNNFKKKKMVNVTLNSTIESA